MFFLRLYILRPENARLLYMMLWYKSGRKSKQLTCIRGQLCYICVKTCILILIFRKIIDLQKVNWGKYLKRQFSKHHNNVLNVVSNVETVSSKLRNQINKWRVTTICNTFDKFISWTKSICSAYSRLDVTSSSWRWRHITFKIYIQIYSNITTFQQFSY